MQVGGGPRRGAAREAQRHTQQHGSSQRGCGRVAKSADAPSERRPQLTFMRGT